MLFNSDEDIFEYEKANEDIGDDIIFGIIYFKIYLKSMSFWKTSIHSDTKLCLAYL